MLPQEEIWRSACKLGLQPDDSNRLHLAWSRTMCFFHVRLYGQPMCDGFCGLKQMLDLLNTNHKNWPSTFYFQPKLVFEGKQVFCGARGQFISKLQQSGWWNIEPVMSHPISSIAYCSVYLNFNGNTVVELLRANIMRSIWIWNPCPF